MSNLQSCTWLSSSPSFSGKPGPNELLQSRSENILEHQESAERAFASHWMSRIDHEIECQNRMAKHLKARQDHLESVEGRHRTWNQRWAARALSAQRWREMKDGDVVSQKAQVEAREAKSQAFLQRRHRLTHDVPNAHLDERALLLMSRSGSRRALDMYRNVRLGTLPHNRNWEPHHGPRPHSYPGPLPC
eukprot:gnl/MRDRNA2_/MRDRNA2_105989_c0_seq1.p1 gnl/MRDRNA2_/MRDRNA2_105989_c0~~gnl/MRDRNA2_/MRDRNA2_105989_c0_seq1.p1  ORF type:complete len:190 (+),score=14.87 gnl/MRDRNA2_/MRDRNA2_105989_c0_seq1:78-647(+)